MKEASKLDPETLSTLLEIINSKDIQLNVRPYYPPGNIAGIIFGGVLCLSGVALSIMGLSGYIEWFLEAGSISSSLTNSSPGITICVIGLLIIWRYKPRLKYKISITPPTIEITNEKMKIVGSRISSEGSASSPITVSPPPNIRWPMR